MSFLPVIPQSGLQGWTFLSRTLEVQKGFFVKAGAANRELEAFRSRVSGIQTADDLINDRDLLSVSLTAFGLEDDINNIFLIKKVLEDGALSPESLANRFSDKRYLELTKAFGFGDFDVPRTQLSDFPDEIISAYVDRKFEISVGEQNENLRLALSFDREILKIVKKDVTEDTKWLQVLGNPPLKSIIQQALSLPTGFENLSLDRQVDVLKEGMESRLGSSGIDTFLEPESRDRLRVKFLLAGSFDGMTGFSGASTALSLLQSRISIRF